METQTETVLKRSTETNTRRQIRRTLGIKQAAGAVGTIEQGCEIYGLTNGHWGLIDLIEHCLATTGPADVLVSTWTAANADVAIAHDLLKNGRIRSLRFVVDSSFPKRQPAYCEAIRAAFGPEAVLITDDHAKFVLIENDEWSLVIRTSMSLEESRRLENFEISDCPKLALFLQETIEGMFSDDRRGRRFS